MEKGKDKVKELLESGKELVGPTIGGGVGGLLGFLAAGPDGAVAGGALGSVVEKLIGDVATRHLSKRESIRVGGATIFVISKIKEKLEQGAILRNDGFFEKKEKDRSDAEEIFEGVLLKAKNEHEEKKAKILSNIFANIAFSPGFSVGESNHVLQIAEKLTYEQMCILSLIERKNEIQGFSLKEGEYLLNTVVSYKTISLLQQILEMYNSGLVRCKDHSGGFVILLEFTDVVPGRLLLSQMGKKYFDIMDLRDIPGEDIRDIGKYLT